MQYFKPFTNIKYPMDKEGSHLIEAVDLMKRVAFSDSNLLNPGNFSLYQIQNGDTPEIIAEKLYGSQHLYWLILLFNKKFNQYTDWSLEQTNLENYYKYKYPGTALFLLEGGTGITPSTKHFNKTDKVFTSADGINPDGNSEAIVQSWDPVLLKLVVYGITGSVADFSAGDNIGATASYGLLGERLNSGATGYNNGRAYISKIVENDYNSVHHFEGLNGEKLNPYGSPIQANHMQVVVGQTGDTGSEFETTSVTFGSTVLHQYVVSGSSIYTITNSQHEDRENRKSGSIRVLNPSAVPAVAQIYENLLKDVQ